MAFTNEEYIDILRHIQSTVKQYEPDLFESLSEIRQVDAPPRQMILRYLFSLIGAYRQRSASTYPRVLSRLNHFIRPIDGRQISGIKVILSPQESELYGMSEVNLSEMPERDNLIEELQRIYGLIESDSPDQRSDLR